jgi:hypothetical protein
MSHTRTALVACCSALFACGPQPEDPTAPAADALLEGASTIEAVGLATGSNTWSTRAPLLNGRVYAAATTIGSTV